MLEAQQPPVTYLPSQACYQQPQLFRSLPACPAAQGPGPRGAGGARRAGSPLGNGQMLALREPHVPRPQHAALLALLWPLASGERSRRPPARGERHAGGSPSEVRARRCRWWHLLGYFPPATCGSFPERDLLPLYSAAEHIFPPKGQLFLKPQHPQVPPQHQHLLLLFPQPSLRSQQREATARRGGQPLRPDTGSSRGTS